MPHSKCRCWVAALAAILSLGACVPRAARLPRALDEISGAVSLGDGAYLAIVDGGNPGRLYRIDWGSAPGAAGPRVTPFGDSLPNVDREAFARDPASGQLFVCDVGDNARARQGVQLYRLDTAGRHLATYRLRYPGGAHDCEACLVEGGVVTLITKAPAINGPRRRVAFVFRGQLREGEVADLSLVDSFALRRRSVTDVQRLEDGSLGVLAYDVRVLGPLILEHTSLLRGTLRELSAGRAVGRPVRSPFVPAQYETLVVDRTGGWQIASERTLWWPARWRTVRGVGGMRLRGGRAMK